LADFWGFRTPPGSRTGSRGLFYINPSPGGGGARNGVPRPVPGSRRDLATRSRRSPGQASRPRRGPSLDPGGNWGPGGPGSRIWAPGAPEPRSRPATSRARALLHQPLAPGPCPRAGRETPLGIPGTSSGVPDQTPARAGLQTPSFPDPRRRAPARGVDVKEGSPGPRFPEKGSPGPQILKIAKKSIFD